MVPNCSLPLHVLDFLDVNTSNDGGLESLWPCEVRAYWRQVRPFVATVQFLLTYPTALIAFLGLIMNTLAFAVLSIAPISRTSLSVFLRALAISDNGAIIFNFSMGLSRAHFPFVSQLFEDNKWLCGASKVLMEVFLFYSTWLVVGLTMKRLIVISSPLNFSKCPVSMAKKIVCLIGFLSLAVACLKLKYSGYEEASVFEYRRCKYKTQLSLKAIYLFSSLSTWLPCIIILGCNALLIRKMRRTHVLRIQLSAHRERLPPKGLNDTDRMLGMLITVSLACLIFMLPLGLVEVFELYWDILLERKPEDPEYVPWLERKLLLKWLRGFFFWIYQWNFAVNFLMYCLSGRQFRLAAQQLCRSWLSSLTRKLTTTRRSSQPSQSSAAIQMQGNITFL